MIDFSGQSVKKCAPPYAVQAHFLEAHTVKVRVYGFSWDITSGATLMDFLGFLRDTSGQQIDDQIMAISPLRGRRELWGGVLLTIKDQRAFTQFTRRGRSFEVTPRQLEANTNPVDVNFFIINTDRGRGLYQYYYHSAALSKFGNFAGHRFMSYKELNGIKTGRLKQGVILRNTAFREYVAQLDRIREIEFEAATYVPEERLFRSLTEQANRARHRLVFFQRQPRDYQSIKRRFLELVEREEISFARIEGFDENGLETVYKLVNDPDTFAEYEYDDFVRTVTINADDFNRTINSAANIRELLRLYDDEEIVNRLMTVEEV